MARFGNWQRRIWQLVVLATIMVLVMGPAGAGHYVAALEQAWQDLW